MNKKIFNPEKYGMQTCPSCDSRGFIQNPNRQCCLKCGGFGYIIKEIKEHTNSYFENESKVPKALN
jgi:DnaJ-class molecular chaperone